jgi:methionyl-tRNA synthetase
MSKSLGNVVDPAVLVDKYGIDPVRYYLLRELPPTEDGDFTYEKFEERYNADLAKGLGNLASRIVTVAKKAGFSGINEEAITDVRDEIETAKNKAGRALGDFKFNEALASIWELAGFCDRYIEKTQPWKTQDKNSINNLMYALLKIAELIGPFLPGTSQKIKLMVENGEASALFPRIEKG